MRQLRLGIVGLGRGATLTAPAFIHHPRIAVVAGADPSGAARDGFARQTGAAVFPDLASLLAGSDAEAVYIASPHELHAEHAIEAVRAGRHVLVEKPMAVRLEDAAAMAAAADAEGRVMMVGPSHGYDPPVALAARLTGGAAGAARLVQALNYTDFIYRPRRPAELDRTLGGGVVFSQASHQIDIARRLVASPVTSVRGWVGDWDPGRRADGAYTALLSFASGAAASLTYSGYGRYDSDALAGWVGELGSPKSPDSHWKRRAALATAAEGAAKEQRGYAGDVAIAPPAHHERFGTVVVSCLHADLELVPDGVVLHGPDGAMLHRVPLPPVQRLGVADCFARAVLDGEAGEFDARWGLETLACCHALIRSATERRDVAPAELIQQVEAA